MPVQADFGNLRRRLTQLEQFVDHPDPLLLILAERLVAHLEANTPVGATGILKQAMLKVRGPYDVAEGRAIGVGDMAMLIDPTVPAPPFTIRDFLSWYRETREEQRERRMAAREALKAERRLAQRARMLEPSRTRTLLRRRMRAIWERISRLERETPISQRTPEWRALIRRLEEAFANLQRRLDG